MAKKEEGMELTVEGKSPTLEQIEVAPELLKQYVSGESEMFSYGLGEKLFMNDLEQRILYLDDEVTPDTFREVTMFIVKMNMIDSGIPIEERLPIKIVINSQGGSILDGLGLIDVIKVSKTPVITVGMGYCMSMAFNIFVAGDLRVAMPNATFLCHDGSTGMYDSTMKFRDTVAFYDKVDERLDRMIASKSKLTIKELNDRKRQENFWFADEGKELGFVDYIIGEDITLDDIFGYAEEECDCKECNCDKE